MKRAGSMTRSTITDVAIFTVAAIGRSARVGYLVVQNFAWSAFCVSKDRYGPTIMLASCSAQGWVSRKEPSACNW